MPQVHVVIMMDTFISQLAVVSVLHSFLTHSIVLKTRFSLSDRPIPAIVVVYLYFPSADGIKRWPFRVVWALPLALGC
jgi:hypothetical protein